MAGENQLLEEEKVWARELAAAAKEAGLQVEDNFTLLSFAIVSKGDTKKGIKRMAKFLTLAEKYKLSNVKSEDADAWCKAKCPELWFFCGQNKEGLVVMGSRASKGDHNQIKTDQDWALFYKNLLMNIQASQTSLASVRRGTVNIMDMNGFGWKQFNLEFQEKMGKLTQESYPVKAKQIHIVNAPTFLGILLGLVKFILPAKIMSRIKQTKPKKLPEHGIEAAILPSELGGTNAEDFCVVRGRELEARAKSVKEVEALPF